MADLKKREPTKEEIAKVSAECAKWYDKLTLMTEQEVLTVHGACISVMLERKQLTFDQVKMIAEILNATPLGEPEKKAN